MLHLSVLSQKLCSIISYRVIFSSKLIMFTLGKVLIVFWEDFIAGFWKSQRPKADKFPLLMLPKKKDAALVELYSLTEGQVVCKLNLPETKGKVCFSSLGWLVTVSKDEGVLTFNLLHPLNRAKIKLPDGRTGLLQYPLEDILKFVLSSNPSTFDFIVMFHSNSSLGFCRPGLGQGWKNLIFKGNNYIMDLTYYKGNFYVVDLSGRVSVVCEIEDPKRVHLSVVAPEIMNKEELLGPMKGIKQLYLVESAGSLLVVLCTYYHNHYESTIGCRVFKVPFSNGNSWSNSEVKNLGNRALFLSKSSSSFSVEVSGSFGCKANCIYFLNNKTISPFLDLDVGIFNMEDGTIDQGFSSSFNTGIEEIREFHLWI